jgi:RsiW-degrading membrane proteinase PrsW (M82 family)
MEISELTLKLIIILIPGAIATVIIDKLTIHKEWSPFKFVVNSIILGIFSYLTLQLVENFLVFIHNLFGSQAILYTNLIIWNTLEDSKTIPYKEVIFSAICGIFIGGIGTLFENYRVINKIGKKLRLTNKYGHENLFSYFLNSKETGYVYLRNFKNDLTYLGYIKSFCETENTSEIVLGDVSVYTCESSDLLYEIEEIYLSFPKTEIIIEKAKTNSNE